MRSRKVFLAVCATCSLAPFASHACTQADVDAVTSVYVEVGMWAAGFNGGYIAAAYKRLGETLDGQSNLNNATSVFVTFTYSASLFGIQGTSLVNLCLEREPGETWESVTTGLAEEIVGRLEDTAPATTGGGGARFAGKEDLDLSSPIIMVGGWQSWIGGSRRGTVTCDPACF